MMARRRVTSITDYAVATIVVLLLWLILASPAAQAQAIPGSANVLANGCGTAQSYIGGQNRPVTQDTSGGLCNSPTVGVTFVPFQITLSAGPTQLLPSGNFKARLICNLDASIVIWIGPSGVSTSTGMPVYPTQCWDVTHTSGAIYAVPTSGTPIASAVEY